MHREEQRSSIHPSVTEAAPPLGPMQTNSTARHESSTKRQNTSGNGVALGGFGHIRGPSKLSQSYVPQEQDEQEDFNRNHDLAKKRSRSIAKSQATKQRDSPYNKVHTASRTSKHETTHNSTPRGQLTQRQTGSKYKDDDPFEGGPIHGKRSTPSIAERKLETAHPAKEAIRAETPSYSHHCRHVSLLPGHETTQYTHVYDPDSIGPAEHNVSDDEEVDHFQDDAPEALLNFDCAQHDEDAFRDYGTSPGMLNVGRHGGDEIASLTAGRAKGSSGAELGYDLAVDRVDDDAPSRKVSPATECAFR